MRGALGYLSRVQNFIIGWYSMWLQWTLGSTYLNWDGGQIILLAPAEFSGLPTVLHLYHYPTKTNEKQQRKKGILMFYYNKFP